MTLTPTEIKELRIAIAEDQGYADKHEFRQSNLGYEFCCKCGSTKEHGHKGCIAPPYTTSLDAIQQAALERFKLDDEPFNFENELLSIARINQCQWQLTALDWAIAYARTAKIWRWKV